MADSVRKIFSILIKVPIIIWVTYLVINIFALILGYFKVLGLSYVVMEVAVENNYIPNDEFDQLKLYAENLVNNAGHTDASMYGSSFSCFDSCAIVDGKLNNAAAPWAGQNEAATDHSARNRRQYGCEITCGVIGHLNFMWPLTTDEYQDASNGNNAVVGWPGPGGSGGSVTTHSATQNAADRYAKGVTDLNTGNNVVIIYTVPGLKYYPDLLTT